MSPTKTDSYKKRIEKINQEIRRQKAIGRQLDKDKKNEESFGAFGGRVGGAATLHFLR